ncbi:MAG: restriction endonuclease subunit S [Leptolyngbyaceae cyanobacterium bins.349]|nr:restriction endonuclease subunit S [Leptolyngbyaceae cyanobacterium bins.349]
MNNDQLTTDNDQLPKGYKQTEVGVIPEDWDVCYLHQISKKITDGEHATPKRTTEGYYLLSARNIHDGRIDLIDVDFVGVNEYQRIRKRCDPDAGDVLISCSGTIGRVAVLPAGLECVMVRSAALIKPDRSKTDGYFIQYVLQSRVGQIQIAQTLNQGAQANLFINHIEGLKVPFPPLPEQRSIAQALSEVDRLIAALEKAIAKKRAIKTATMQQLLTGKKRLPGFGEGKGYQQTEIGVIPEDWDVKSLLELSERITVGIASAATHAYRTRGIPLIRNQNIKPNKLDDDDILYISEEYELRFKNKRLQKGDLLTARTGYPGTTCIVPEEFELAQSFTTLITRPNHAKVDCQFLSFFINSDSGQSFFEQNQIGGGQKNVNAGTLRNLLVPLPSLKEQRAIATVLSDMDAEIAALETRLAKTQSIKQGMMQALLTGRTRLV